MGVGYDSADLTIEREFVVPAAGGAATTAYGKFRSFNNVKLLAVKAVVAVAGTAAGHGFDIYSGTTSIGTIALGTAAADSVVTTTVNVDVTAPGLISVKSLADTVGKADIVYQYRRT